MANSVRAGWIVIPIVTFMVPGLEGTENRDKIDISIFCPEIETNFAVFLNIAKTFDSISNLQFTIEIGSRQTLVLMIPSN